MGQELFQTAVPDPRIQTSSRPLAVLTSGIRTFVYRDDTVYIYIYIALNFVHPDNKVAENTESRVAQKRVAESRVAENRAAESKSS